MTDNLTPKQEAFCLKYIETGNASEAYRCAYDAENMKAEAVWVEASRLMDNPTVSLRINELKESLRKRHEVTAERIVAEYAKLAFLDIRKAFDEEGRLKSIHEIDDDTASAISGIEVESLFEGRGVDKQMVGRLHKVKLSDKKGALDSLARHLGMFTDKAELSGPGGTPLAGSSVTVAITPELVKSLVQQVRDEF